MATLHSMPFSPYRRSHWRSSLLAILFVKRNNNNKMLKFAINFSWDFLFVVDPRWSYLTYIWIGFLGDQISVEIWIGTHGEYRWGMNRTCLTYDAGFVWQDCRRRLKDKPQIWRGLFHIWLAVLSHWLKIVLFAKYCGKKHRWKQILV